MVRELGVTEAKVIEFGERLAREMKEATRIKKPSFFGSFSFASSFFKPKAEKQEFTVTPLIHVDTKPTTLQKTPGGKIIFGPGGEVKFTPKDPDLLTAHFENERPELPQSTALQTGQKLERISGDDWEGDSVGGDRSSRDLGTKRHSSSADRKSKELVTAKEIFGLSVLDRVLAREDKDGKKQVF